MYRKRDQQRHLRLNSPDVRLDDDADRLPESWTFSSAGSAEARGFTAKYP